MAFNPDIKYNDIINPLDEDVYCGITYNPERFSVQYIKLGQVFTADCSDFDETVNVDEAHAFNVKFLEFSNGTYYKLSAWKSTGWDNNDTVTIRIDGYDRNNTRLPGAGGGSNMLLNGSGGGGNFGCPITYFKTIGVKFSYMTSYYSYGSDNVHGVTPPQFFGLFYFAPLAYYPGQEVQGNNILSLIEDGALFTVADSGVGDLPYLNDPVSPFWNWLIYIQDVEAYLEALGGLDYKTGSPDDPNQDTDPSGTGGGNGNYKPADGTGGGGYTKDSQPVDFPDLPTNGALSTGSIKAFIVDTGIIHTLFQELWNSNIIDIATWQKLFNDPMSAFVSLHCLPFVPTNTGGSAAIHLGNIDFNDMITAVPITNQYKRVDCGKYTLKPFWGSALDLSPYTKVEIFIPFVGIRQIKVEDCLNLEMQLKYNVDVLTGDVTAQLKCGMSVLYKWQGNCKATVPVSSEVNGAIEKIIKFAGTAAGGAAANGGAMISAAVNVALSKTGYARSGDLSGSVGLLDEFLPYLIVHRPVQSLPQNFRKFKGYPSNITATLSSLSGYTEVEHINLSVAGATDEELREIEELLKQGVLL